MNGTPMIEEDTRGKEMFIVLLCGRKAGTATGGWHYHQSCVQAGLNTDLGGSLRLNPHVKRAGSRAAR